MVEPRSIASPRLLLNVLLFLRENGQFCELQVIITIILLRSQIVIGPPLHKQLIIACLGRMSCTASAAVMRDRAGPQ